MLTKEKCIEWAEKKLKDEREMQDTINTEHPDYEGSETEDCFKMHERNIVMYESILKHLRA